MSAILKRNFKGNETQDEGAIANMEYSNAAGSKKVSEVGRHLLPLPMPGASPFYTTDISAGATALPSAGVNLAVYNNSGAVQTITLGSDNTVTVLGVGGCDTSGRVGIPCAPNAWTYIATGPQSWAISSSSNLVVFLIDDNSYIIPQSATNASV